MPRGRPRREARAGPRHWRGWRHDRAAKLVAVAVAATGLAGWFALRPRAPSVAPSPTSGMETIPPREAYERALRLEAAGRHVESLPYFRAAAAAGQRDIQWLHTDYAAALYNGCFQVRDRPRTVATRSSFERVAIMHESLREMRLAAQFDTLWARAELLEREGNMVQTWGFVWEAYFRFRAAQQADSVSPRDVTHAHAFMVLMRHPDHFVPDAVPALSEP